MFLIGIILIVIAVFLFVSSWIDESKIRLILGLIFLVSGLFLFIYDITSPVEITQKTIISNSYSNITFEESMEITIYDKEAIRFGAVWNDKPEFKIEVKAND